MHIYIKYIYWYVGEDCTLNLLCQNYLYFDICYWQNIYLIFFVKIYHTCLKLINYCECGTACVVRILFEKKLHRLINAFFKYIHMFCENSNSLRVRIILMQLAYSSILIPRNFGKRCNLVLHRVYNLKYSLPSCAILGIIIYVTSLSVIHVFILLNKVKSNQIKIIILEINLL